MVSAGLPVQMVPVVLCSWLVFLSRTHQLWRIGGWSMQSRSAGMLHMLWITNTFCQSSYWICDRYTAKFSWIVHVYCNVNVLTWNSPRGLVIGRQKCMENIYGETFFVVNLWNIEEIEGRHRNETWGNRQEEMSVLSPGFSFNKLYWSN
jgi:hypothetical protein